MCKLTTLTTIDRLCLSPCGPTSPQPPILTVRLSRRDHGFRSRGCQPAWQPPSIRGSATTRQLELCLPSLRGSPLHILHSLGYSKRGAAAVRLAATRLRRSPMPLRATVLQTARVWFRVSTLKRVSLNPTPEVSTDRTCSLIKWSRARSNSHFDQTSGRARVLSNEHWRQRSRRGGSFAAIRMPSGKGAFWGTTIVKTMERWFRFRDQCSFS